MLRTAQQVCRSPIEVCVSPEGRGAFFSFTGPAAPLASRATGTGRASAADGRASRRNVCFLHDNEAITSSRLTGSANGCPPRFDFVLQAEWQSVAADEDDPLACLIPSVF
jgi:hypothetical protein